MDAQIDALISEAGGEPALTGRPAPREALDREEQLIRDSVLRMGALVEAAIREASRALTSHDAALALDVIKGDAIINEAQRGVSRLIAVTIATQQPVARDLRYLLTLDHVTYELERMGDHASSRRQAGPEAGAGSAARGLSSTCPRWPNAGAVLVHGVLRALVDADAVQARQIAVEDDEIDRLYHATFDEVIELMRAGPGQRRARDADHHRLALPRTDRRPGDQHRRGRRLPRDRRRRGPQSVTDRPDPRPVRVHGQLRPERDGRSAGPAQGRRRASRSTAPAPSRAASTR